MREIELSRGHKALVDDEDYERVSRHNWSAVPCGRNRSKVYARTKIKVNGRTTTISMHRMVLGVMSDVDVDHVNNSGTDNRKENLRLATRAENVQNSKKRRGTRSTFKGICFVAGKGWKATIDANGKRHFLGYFEHEADAHSTYAEATKRFHGEFANPRGGMTDEDYLSELLQKTLESNLGYDGK